jgi:ABC-2 type transport system permease protein
MAEVSIAPIRSLGPRSRGWRVIAAKEFADHLVSIRFKILIALVGLAGLGAVYGAASQIRNAAGNPQTAQAVIATPSLFLKIFTIAPEQVPLSYLAMVGLLVPLLGIAFGFDAVNGERSQGTLPRLVAQPIHRDDVVNGKFLGGLAVIGLMIGLLTVLVGLVGVLRLGVPIGWSDVLRLILFLVVALIYAGFWLALSTLFSVVLTRAATSALAAIAAWLVLTIFAGLLIGLVADAMKPVPENPTFEEQLANAKVKVNLSRISPNTLFQESSVVLLQPEERTVDLLGTLLLQSEPRALPNPLSIPQSILVVWPQVAGLLALTAACFAGAYIYFMRQEVRA